LNGEKARHVTNCQHAVPCLIALDEDQDTSQLNNGRLLTDAVGGKLSCPYMHARQDRMTRYMIGSLRPTSHRPPSHYQVSLFILFPKNVVQIFAIILPNLNQFAKFFLLETR